MSALCLVAQRNTKRLTLKMILLGVVMVWLSAHGQTPSDGGAANSVQLSSLSLTLEGDIALKLGADCIVALSGYAEEVRCNSIIDSFSTSAGDAVVRLGVMGAGSVLKSPFLKGLTLHDQQSGRKIAFTSGGKPAHYVWPHVYKSGQRVLLAGTQDFWMEFEAFGSISLPTKQSYGDIERSWEWSQSSTGEIYLSSFVTNEGNQEDFSITGLDTLGTADAPAPCMEGQVLMVWGSRPDPDCIDSDRIRFDESLIAAPETQTPDVTYQYDEYGYTQVTLGSAWVKFAKVDSSYLVGNSAGFRGKLRNVDGGIEITSFADKTLHTYENGYLKEVSLNGKLVVRNQYEPSTGLLASREYVLTGLTSRYSYTNGVLTGEVIEAPNYVETNTYDPVFSNLKTSVIRAGAKQVTTTNQYDDSHRYVDSIVTEINGEVASSYAISSTLEDGVSPERVEIVAPNGTMNISYQASTSQNGQGEISVSGASMSLEQGLSTLRANYDPSSGLTQTYTSADGSDVVVIENGENRSGNEPWFLLNTELTRLVSENASSESQLSAYRSHLDLSNRYSIRFDVNEYDTSMGYPVGKEDFLQINGLPPVEEYVDYGREEFSTQEFHLEILPVNGANGHFTKYSSGCPCDFGSVGPEGHYGSSVSCRIEIKRVMKEPHYYPFAYKVLLNDQVYPVSYDVETEFLSGPMLDGSVSSDQGTFTKCKLDVAWDVLSCADHSTADACNADEYNGCAFYNKTCNYGPPSSCYDFSNNESECIQANDQWPYEISSQCYFDGSSCTDTPPTCESLDELTCGERSECYAYDSTCSSSPPSSCYDFGSDEESCLNAQNDYYFAMPCEFDGAYCTDATTW